MGAGVDVSVGVGAGVNANEPVDVAMALALGVIMEVSVGFTVADGVAVGTDTSVGVHHDVAVGKMTCSSLLSSNLGPRRTAIVTRPAIRRNPTGMQFLGDGINSRMKRLYSSSR
jgi:hypothetical protein